MGKTLEDKLSEEKETKRKANILDNVEALNDELGDENLQVVTDGSKVIIKNRSETDEKKPSGFEKSTVEIAKALHNPGGKGEGPELSELHSVIPRAVFPSALEMEMIYKSALKEHQLMTKEHTVDEIQQKMNSLYVAEMGATNEHLFRELSAIEGPQNRAAQGERNIGSLVTGENMLNASENGSPGVFGRFKKFFLGDGKH